jgi:hypothetical protein
VKPPDSETDRSITAAIRRNLSERSNALGLKCVGRIVAEDVGTAERWHDAIAMS